MSLWDLVQFECLRRRPERALRVSSQGQVGFMYFRDGNVVHASTLRATGEPAMREMLRWTTGSVEPWPARWPERESISAPWQSLLLGAAHAADQCRRQVPRARAGARAPRIALAADLAAAGPADHREGGAGPQRTGADGRHRGRACPRRRATPPRWPT